MKPPKNIPERGDRTALRGNPSATGTLSSYDPENEWAIVAWDDGVKAPKFCHRFELIKLLTEK